MDVAHDDPDLERLETDITFSGGRAQSLVRQFRRLMNLVHSVPNETELYKFPSRHFEKLKGKRKHQHSLRLDDQWRLVVELETREQGTLIRIKEIVDYH